MRTNVVHGEIANIGSWLKRTLTAPLRALPDFLIVGAQKAGTSSLFAYLSQHPNVRSAQVKEVHYFDLHFDRSLHWYRAHFPSRVKLDRREHDVTGEASPDYLYHPQAARRIGSVVPDAKLIVLLRDPVARAYSHYHHERDRGREPLPTFEDAVRAEPRRLRPRNGARAVDRYTRAHRRHSYVARGRYAQQLRRYLDVFPRHKILVLFSESMFSDPHGTYEEVLEFLDLPAHALEHVKPTNVGTYERKDAIPLEDELRERFEAPNRELEKLLGTVVPW